MFTAHHGPSMTTEVVADIVAGLASLLLTKAWLATGYGYLDADHVSDGTRPGKARNDTTVHATHAALETP